MQQCEAPQKPFGALGLEGEGLQVKATGPVIDPRYCMAFEELHWWDSLPFDISVLADAGVQFVEVEQFRLPVEESAKLGSRDLGRDVGDHRLLATYGIDPRKKLIRSIRIKDFRKVLGMQPPYSVSARFEDIGMGMYQTVHLLEMQGSETTVQEEGTWRFGDDGLPSMLRFQTAPSQYFLHKRGVDATLANWGVWTVEAYFADADLDFNQIERKCADVKAEMLAQAGLGPATEVCCYCNLGDRTRRRLAVLIDRDGQPSEAFDWEYDSLGRMQGFSSKPLDSAEFTRWVRYRYDDAGRIGSVSDSSSAVERVVEFKYLPTGWPEKVVACDIFPDGKTRTVWRTFFKFERI